jgi:F0F1-type ATP synthase assembly protein I
MAMLGIGLDLAVPVALFGLLGHWLDRKWGTAPWLSVVGLLLGMVVGFYNLWKRVAPRSGDGGPA